MRDPLDIGRLAFVVGTIVYAALGRSTAIGLAFATLAVLTGRIVGLPRPYDLSLMVAMFLIGWGTALNLYGDFHDYDKIVHGLAALCYSPVIYILLIRLDVMPELNTKRQAHNHFGVFLVTLALGMAISAGYEIVEFSSDNLLGTTFQKGNWDTMTDLIAGTSGAAIGGLLLVVWSTVGWGTVRRLSERSLERGT